MGTMANSENPDEMPHKGSISPGPALFAKQIVQALMKCCLCANAKTKSISGISSGPALFAKTKSIFRERNAIVFGNYDL